MTMKTYKLESGDAFHAASALIDSQAAVIKAAEAIGLEAKARIAALIASHTDSSRRLWCRILQPFGIDGAKVFDIGGTSIDANYREHGIIFVRHDDAPPSEDAEAGARAITAANKAAMN